MCLVEVVEDDFEDRVQLVDHFLDMLEVGRYGLLVRVVIWITPGIRREVAQVVALVVGILSFRITFIALLANYSIEWI